MKLFPVLVLIRSSCRMVNTMWACNVCNLTITENKMRRRADFLSLMYKLWSRENYFFSLFYVKTFICKHVLRFLVFYGKRPESMFSGFSTTEDYKQNTEDWIPNKTGAEIRFIFLSIIFVYQFRKKYRYRVYELY